MPTTPNTSATTRKANATKRSTAAKKAAQTRSANQAAQARTRTETATKKAAEARVEAAKTPVDRIGAYAERAALVQVGAALVARDAVTEVVDSLRTSLSSRDKVEKELQVRRRRLEAELKRFERRGSTEVKRFEREAKKTRTRVEKDIKGFRADVTKQVKPLTSQADLVTARVENLLQTGLTAGQKAATTVQERVASVV
ncbi:MAG TPA: hypothetical protein VNT55_21330 [Baekduia sp.]|nr:hypothetical protein [Baekduia sp.]